MTYDHVLARAQRILGIEPTIAEEEAEIDPNDIPF